MKKIYRDENGRFCKQWQTPKRKAQIKERDKIRWQTPEAKAKQRIRQQTPEYKAKRKEREQTPEHKAREKARRQTLEFKAKRRADKQTSEYKAWEKVYEKTAKRKAQRRAIDATRRAKKLQREILLTKSGRKAIAEIYANCPDDWHVDHIAPLLGETISGLHHPDNLQHLPKWVNHMKGNRWEESWIEHTIDTPLEEKIKAYQLNYEGEKWHE